MTLREAIERYVPARFCDENGVPHDSPHRAAALEELDNLENTIADFRTLAGGLLEVYTAASVSDEEGLLMSVDPDEMRQLWHRVDEAAFDLGEFLSQGQNSQASNKSNG